MSDNIEGKTIDNTTEFYEPPIQVALTLEEIGYLISGLYCLGHPYPEGFDLRHKLENVYNRYINQRRNNEKE